MDDKNREYYEQLLGKKLAVHDRISIWLTNEKYPHRYILFISSLFGFVLVLPRFF